MISNKRQVRRTLTNSISSYETQMKKGNLYELSDSTGFDDVEMEEKHFKTNLCVDNSGFCMIFLIILAYFIILLFYLIMGIVAPKKLTENVNIIPIESIENIGKFDLDLRIKNFKDTDLFFDINCSLIKSSPAESQKTIQFDVVEKHRFFQGEKMSDFSESTTLNNVLTFKKNQKRTNKFNLLALKVENFDSFALSLTITTNDTDFSAVAMDYFYVNPSSIRYINAIKYIFSACGLFCTLIFLLGQTLPNSQTLLICFLGFSLIFSSNPASLIIPMTDKVMIDSLLTAFAVNLFRFFLIVQFIFVYRHKFQVSFPLLFILIVFFTIFALVDFFAMEEHQSTLMKYASSENCWEPLYLEKVRIGMIFAYSILVIVSIILVNGKVDDHEFYRYSCLLIYSITPLIITIITQIIFTARSEFQTSLFPDLLFYASHLIGASCLIILFCGVNSDENNEDDKWQQFITRSKYDLTL